VTKALWYDIKTQTLNSKTQTLNSKTHTQTLNKRVAEELGYDVKTFRARQQAFRAKEKKEKEKSEQRSASRSFSSSSRH
jgi:outer membrane murein-binding lipoprotein Lpp